MGLGLLASGCASTEGQQQLDTRIVGLEQQIDELRGALTDARSEIAARDAAAASVNAQLSSEVTGIGRRLDALPEALAEMCPPPAAEATPVAEKCEPVIEVRTVTVSSDKLVVGEVERVLIEPPGTSVVARIDTGADSSSLHAEEVVVFERDGSRWVRFNVNTEAGVETLERPIKRFVKIVQQADPKGSRRPVVDLRVRLGPTSETVDVTLADRSHMDHEMILGRNFLTDVAVVDVGQQFVQPLAKTAEKEN